MIQEVVAYALVGAAVVYLVQRRVRRRRGNCCGEKECPAASRAVDKINQARREARVP